MLTPVADGVLVHESSFCQTNTVVVDGPDGGVLLIDPGVLGDELACLANDLASSGRTVAVGFSTHPHWDHLLWHPSLGKPPRYGTAACAASVRERLAGGIDAKRAGIPDEVPLDLLGDITGLPADASGIPWDGPAVRILEHRAHAAGHAVLLVEERGVLVAGDMLSDVLMPMLDLMGAADPLAEHLAALDLFAGLAAGVQVVVPGHGSVTDAGGLRARIERDRAYVLALLDGRSPDDPRIGPAAAPGWEWVSDVHAGQVQRLASLRG